MRYGIARLLLPGTLIATALAVMPILVGPVAAKGATTALRQSLDMRVPMSPTPVTVDGAPQLLYELHLANYGLEPLTLQQVDVLDAGDASVLAELRGEDLQRRLGRPGAPPSDSDPRTIRPGTLGVLYLELELEDGAPPRELEHRISFHRAGENARDPAVARGARIPVRAEPPVVLAPPLRGGPWAAAYSPSLERGHRRVVYVVEGRARIPGRHAIDWVRLDPEGRRARGNDDEVRNWHGYAADVLAVGDGVVAATRDDVPESPTLSGHPSHPLEDATGNYVALDLGHGRIAFYEHLKPGSVRVEPGERVRRGQVIGSVGFTGHSMGPHLHFHVADAPSPLGAEGLPFVFEGFRVLGAYDGIDTIGDAPWSPPADSSGSARIGELPAPNVVLDFGNE